MTYTIIGRDPAAGQIGVALQSHHLAAGAHVIAAEANLGIMAVQSYADRSFAVEGMSHLRQGAAPGEVLSALVEGRPRRSLRAQLGVLAFDGAPSAFTGEWTVQEAGHVTRDDAVALGNMLTGRSWEAAADAFEAEDGVLAARLLAALVMFEKVGGDVRGQQSAALLVLERDADGPLIDLRVDDHPDALAEMRRLVRMKLAADDMTQAFALAKAGAVDDASRLLEGVQEVYGNDNLEPTAWQAVLLLRAGRWEDAEVVLRRAAAGNGQWGRFVRALPDAHLLDVDGHRLESLRRQIEGTT